MKGYVMQTYKIEVRAHFANADKKQVMEEVCRQAARTVLATAILLSEKGTPEAKLFMEDYIEGVTPIDLEGGEN
jgi:hypothetical protein